jgi:L-alanine-DL-glutamate epimerase-like enolase superfamily enzyme
MWWRLHFVGRGGLASFAIAAVDIWLWDLAARRAGEPLWRSLAGTDPNVRAYAGGVDLHLTPRALCEQASAFLDQGFRAIKVKAGRDDLREDIARVETVRRHAGQSTILMVDANMRWSAAEAIRAAAALAEFDVYWLEEPTIPDDIEGHIRIARQGGLPIAAGENLHTVHEFRRMIRSGAVAFPEPDVATVGGISVWMEVAKEARSRGLPVTSHGVHDLHVHLLAAVPNASFLEVHAFGLDRFIQHPLSIDAGTATAPDRPGHGVVLDWESLEPHRWPVRETRF